MDKNGYFQIEKKADGLYVHVIPAEGNGKKPVMEEFIAYLDKKKVPYSNPVELRKAFELALCAKRHDDQGSDGGRTNDMVLSCQGLTRPCLARI